MSCVVKWCKNRSDQKKKCQGITFHSERLPSMCDNEIFVFGSKIFPDIKRDALSSLPLELSWRIFSYLDDTSLRKACQVTQIWRRIILSCSKLRRRLNRFELAFKLGSENMAKFYRHHKRKFKKAKKRFLSIRETIEESTTIEMVKKRKGDNFVVFTKRFKIF